MWQTYCPTVNYILWRYISSGDIFHQFPEAYLTQVNRGKFVKSLVIIKCTVFLQLGEAFMNEFTELTIFRPRYKPLTDTVVIYQTP